MKAYKNDQPVLSLQCYHLSTYLHTPGHQGLLQCRLSALSFSYSCRLQAINRRRAGELEELQGQVSALSGRLAAAENARDEAQARVQVRQQSLGRGAGEMTEPSVLYFVESLGLFASHSRVCL
jgi:hypothetical protein